MAAIHRAIAFIVIGISALLLSGYMFFENTSSSLLDGFSFDTSLPVGFFSKITLDDDDYIYASIEIDGVFDGELDIDVKDVGIRINSSSLQYYMREDLMRVYGMVSFINYSGSIAYLSNGDVFMRGKIKGADSPYFDIFFPKYKRVVVNDTIRGTLGIENLKLDKLNIENFEGEVKIRVKGDSILYNVSGKDLELERITGKILFSQDRVIFKGEGVIKTNVLVSPIKS